jgi:cysteine-rich repeat protein
MPRAEVCGNGIIDGCEECDDGNAVDSDGCPNSCQLRFCGDGVLDPSEDCDDLAQIRAGCSG